MPIPLRDLIPELLETPAKASMTTDAEYNIGARVVHEEEMHRSSPQMPTILDPRHSLPLHNGQRKFAEDELPWDMHVAMNHPSIDWMIVIALADFSHGVKKAANSFERGNLLGIEGHPMNIYMLRDCYLECPDMKTDGKDYLNTLCLYICDC